MKVNNGDKCPDAVIAEDGLSVDLRSERLGPPYSPGRIYHLDYEAEIDEADLRRARSPSACRTIRARRRTASTAARLRLDDLPRVNAAQL